MKSWKFKNMRHRLCLVLACICIGTFACMDFGCNGKGSPTGSGLPPGLEIEEIRGDTELCSTTGGLFHLIIHIRNTTTNNITYVLPAGIQFISNNGNAQDMMLLQKYTVTVEPDTTEIVCLPVYCLDAELDAPDASHSYSLGSVVTHSGLKEIIDLAAGKTIDITEAFAVQMIIWDCIESGSLSPDGRTYLENL